MRTLKTTFAFVLLASFLLVGCNKYKQDTKDTTAPFLEIGIPIDQKTLVKSTKEWGLTQNYVQLKGKQPNIVGSKGRVYEFYVSAKDKGGLESINIEVCPSDALVPGSLKELQKTFDPAKTGSYLVSGKIRELDRDEKISIIATVKGKDRNGSQIHTTSIYGYANQGLLFQSGGRPHQNLCQTSTNNIVNKAITISMGRMSSPDSKNYTYCGCIFSKSSTNSVCQPAQTNNGQNINCIDPPVGFNLPANSQGKWIQNKSSVRIGLNTPGGPVSIGPNQRISYNGPLFGTWYANFSQGAAGSPAYSVTVGY